MIQPEFILDASDTRLRAHLNEFPVQLRLAMHKTIANLTQELLARVRAAEPRRTGYMLSQTRGFVDSAEDYILGRVRVLATGSASRSAAAFGALEYGAHRRFPVRGYMRAGIAVRAYNRTANIQQRRFLRGSLDAMRSKALEQIKETLGETVAKSNAP